MLKLGFTTQGRVLGESVACCSRHVERRGMNSTDLLLSSTLVVLYFSSTPCALTARPWYFYVLVLTFSPRFS